LGPALFPFAGPTVGLCLIPPVGANVWAEFDGGDTNNPTWTGCFWGKGEYLSEAQVTPPERVQVLKSYGFKLVANSVGPTGLTIEDSPPILGRTLRIVLDDNGILVSNEHEMTLKLTESLIEMAAQRQSKMSISANEIEIATAMPSIKLSDSSPDLTNAGSIVKTPVATVNVSTGALEVTSRPCKSADSYTGPGAPPETLPGRPASNWARVLLSVRQ